MPPLGNGPLIKLEGFSTMSVWLAEGLMPLGRLTVFRTMTVLRMNHDPKHLILINAIRLDVETERSLLKLGQITDVLRQTSHHAGFDDLYYVEKFFAVPHAFKTVSRSELKQSTMLKEGWAWYSVESPPECLRPQVQVLEVPVKDNHAECVFYFPREKCIIVSQLIQNNDFDHSKFYGMSLSELKISKASHAMLILLGFRGHLHTPKFYWSTCFSRHADDLFQFHGQLMDLDWDRVICHHGGPSLQSAKRIRKDHMKDWPSVSFGKNVQLTLA